MKQTAPIIIHYIARNKKQTICQLFDEHIYCKVWKKDEPLEEYRFKYSDIVKIHLGLSDVSWYTIDIYFVNKVHLHLKSITFVLQHEDLGLQRPKINEIDNALVQENQDNYHRFVRSLHEHALIADPVPDIKFSAGNPWMKTLLWIFLVAFIIWIPVTLHMGYFRWTLFFCSAFIFLLFFNNKLNFRKNYLPNNIPSRYLPPDRTGWPPFK